MSGIRRTAAAACLAIGVTVLALAGVSGANHATVERVSIGSIGGNGNFNAFVDSVSADGSKVVFSTAEALAGGDGDCLQDIYLRSGSTTTRISTGANLGNFPFTPSAGQISPDGSRVFFSTAEQLEPTDTDTNQDLYVRSGTTTAQVSIGSSGGNGVFGVNNVAGMSTDGFRVFFETGETLEPDDTDGSIDVYERSGTTTTRISTGPTGGNGGPSAFFVGATPDGSRVYFTTHEPMEPTDTDSSADIYERTGSTTTRISLGSAGGNGIASAGFRAVAPDGSRVIFDTFESLEPDDTDTANDVYVRAGSTTTRLSTGSAGGNASLSASFAGASADASRVFFTTNEPMEPTDTDSSADIYERTGSTTTRISTGASGGNGAFGAFFAGASADGSRVFFITDESLEPGDTDTSADLYERTGSTTTRITTGTSGGNGAFAPAFRAASTDGSRVFFTTDEQLEPGDTDSQVDAYERSGSTTTLLSTGPNGGNGSAGVTWGGISADGTNVFFAVNDKLVSADTDNAFDVYKAALASTAGYPRPQGATPFRVSLVPVYDECTQANTSHSAPFAFGACNPPTLASDWVTVGTPDANGQPVKFVGSLKIEAVVGAPGGPDDSDAALTVSIVDVRNQGGLSDYTGELRANAKLRITDKAAGPDQTTPATVADVPFNVTVPCSATGDTTIGGSCVLNTSLDTLLGPSAVVEGKRGIFKMDRVDVYDGGADGDVDTPSGDTLFASQGFFVP